MIEAAQRVLGDRGFAPKDIVTEGYWPAT